MAAVLTRDIIKKFGEVPAVNGITLAVPDGEFMVLLGPSGCGKTTFLRIICGLERQTSGDLMIGGDVVNDIPPRARGVAMMFQSYGLYPHFTVRKNIAFPLRTQRVPNAEIEKKVEWASQLLGIGHLLDRRPRQLSGGERQRVALARALVREPTALLLDEPLSNLDAKLRASARLEIKQFQQRVGITTIYVTHDQVEAMGMGDRIAVIDHGRMRQVGTPTEIYDDPADRFVATFVGTPPMNLVARNGGFLGFRPENFLPKEMIDDGTASSPNFRSASIVPNISAPSGSSMARSKASIQRRWSRRNCRRRMSPRKASGPASGIPSPCATARCAISTRTASGPVVTETGFLRWSQSPNQSPNRPRAFGSCWTGATCSAPSSSRRRSFTCCCWSVVPLLLSVYYSVSAYTIYDPSWRFVGLANFAQILENPVFLRNAGQHLYLHVRIAIPRSRPRQVRRAVAVAAVPGAQDRQGADYIALGGADRARHRRLAMDVRFALQRHQLDHDRARLITRSEAPNWLGNSASGDAVRDRRQCLAFLPVCDRRSSSPASPPCRRT